MTVTMVIMTLFTDLIVRSHFVLLDFNACSYVKKGTVNIFLKCASLVGIIGFITIRRTSLTEANYELSVI